MTFPTACRRTYLRRRKSALETSGTGRRSKKPPVAARGSFTSLHWAPCLDRTHDVNVAGSYNVLLAARAAGAERIVFSSSSSVYGDDPRLPKQEDRLGRPLSPYAASKRANEIEAEGFAAVFPGPIVGLRYFNVFGPRQRYDSPPRPGDVRDSRASVAKAKAELGFEPAYDLARGPSKSLIWYRESLTRHATGG